MSKQEQLLDENEGKQRHGIYVRIDDGVKLALNRKAESENFSSGEAWLSGVLTAATFTELPTFTLKVETDERDARIAQLERELAELQEQLTGAQTSKKEATS